MIPSSDVDIAIVYNEDLLDKVEDILTDIPWIRTVKVGFGSELKRSISRDLFRW